MVWLIDLDQCEKNFHKNGSFFDIPGNGIDIPKLIDLHKYGMCRAKIRIKFNTVSRSAYSGAMGMVHQLLIDEEYSFDEGDLDQGAGHQNAVYRVFGLSTCAAIMIVAPQQLPLQKGAASWKAWVHHAPSGVLSVQMVARVLHDLKANPATAYGLIAHRGASYSTYSEPAESMQMNGMGMSNIIQIANLPGAAFAINSAGEIGL